MPPVAHLADDCSRHALAAGGIREEGTSWHIVRRVEQQARHLELCPCRGVADARRDTMHTVPFRCEDRGRRFRDSAGGVRGGARCGRPRDGGAKGGRELLWDAEAGERAQEDCLQLAVDDN